MEVKDVVVDNPTSAALVDEGNWILLEETGLWKGWTKIVDKNSGNIVCLSSRSCGDEDRKTVLPSLKEFGSLKVVDLDGYRYISTLEEACIGDLAELQRLSLTRCSLLTSLPSSLGNLTNLTEVRGVQRVQNQPWKHIS